ncbi:MAG: SoxR reducing system RseC family protein [Clostridia bacterium]|nr:SoxR reducing system RseC family protein [Clostridia bacterium]
MSNKELVKDHPLGVVKEIKDNRVTVIFRRSSACGKCEACGLLKETGEMFLEFDYEEQVEKGEAVGVYVDEKFFLLSAFLLYGIPLVMLLAGIGISSIFFNDGYGQLLAALIGFTLCVGTYFVLKRYDGYFEKIKKKYMKYTKI